MNGTVPRTVERVTANGTMEMALSIIRRQLINEREVVTLTNARPKDLRAWPATAVIDVDLIVQVRHSPCVMVPLVELKEEEAGLSGMLSRHLP